MKPSISIIWFEQDLRLQDNPALVAALSEENCLPIFILDDDNAGEYRLGSASRWWLHHSLSALNDSLAGQLNFYMGDACQILSSLCDRFDVKSIHWNRRYEPWRIARDKQIKQQLLTRGIEAQSYNGRLVNEPWAVKQKNQSFYRVYTPYARQARRVALRADVVPAPQQPLSLVVDPQAQPLSSLALLPTLNWDDGFYACWQPGEQGARQALNRFLDDGVHHYHKGRDLPAGNAVSRLSPHLHFGEISVRSILRSLSMLPSTDHTECFEKELFWREFAYHLIFYYPQLPAQNLKPQFDAFPWLDNDEGLQRWQQGMTGYPLVDAGMRELWQTGYIHNRVRMVVASFLIKNLMIDWRHGARWFWDCLVDADLANNSAGWQWIAGSGTDASPFFRIFNSVTQSEKFDANGDYIKRFVPELKGLSGKHLHSPWLAPADVLAQAGVVLGQTYPLPIVDLKDSRERALEGYALTQQVVEAS